MTDRALRPPPSAKVVKPSTAARRRAASFLERLAARLDAPSPSASAPPPGAAASDPANTTAPESPRSPDDQWFHDHLESAHDILAFLGGDGLSLEGRRVADIGCGDGIIDLGLAHLGRPAELVGFDLKPTDTVALLERSRRYGFLDALPPNLTFRGSSVDGIPAEPGSFDTLISWSCFEHVSQPDVMARDMRRVVTDDGILMLQLWPFYFSAHGAHLQDWFPEGWAHLVRSDDELRAGVFADASADGGWPEYKWQEYQALNQITIDDLQAALQGAGFRITKVQLIAHGVHLPPGVERFPLSRLAIGGVMLLANAV
jgi:2-polyprenyl-3-methyl-5-hydroxy-6-metoxy-1,4-benzoquinol methylase